jgi:hypothetical protein
MTLAQKVADLFAALPQVEAVTLGGSQAGGLSDASSDIDLYLYTRADIPLAERQAVLTQCGGASRADLGLTFWGAGDEWFDLATGIEVDVVYFDAGWMENQITRVLVEHQASLGYTTCFWHTVRQAGIFHDANGWFHGLQHVCRQDYPEPLRQNIIALNHPVLRNVIPSYSFQLEKAVKRGDQVSVNHRLAALLASYFDVLFALNRVLHPGEKRLVQHALALCPQLPVDLAADVDFILRVPAERTPDLLVGVDRLLDGLDGLLENEGFDPLTSRPKIAA